MSLRLSFRGLSPEPIAQHAQALEIVEPWVPGIKPGMTNKMWGGMKLTLLSGGAAQGLVAALAPALQRNNGASIDGTFGAVGAMREKLGLGAPADLLILTQAMIAQLTASGDVVPGSAVDIGAVATAVAVRKGDPLPLVGKPDLLKEALLAADVIFFPDPKLATAGIHVAGVLAKLGLERETRARLRLYPNGATAMKALAEARDVSRPIGLTQASEILATPGVTLVGPLVAPFALTTVYTAGIAARARQPGLARQFAAMLADPAAAQARAKAGFG